MVGGVMFLEDGLVLILLLWWMNWICVFDLVVGSVIVEVGVVF